LEGLDVNPPIFCPLAAFLAQRIQLGCTADLERCGPILGSKFKKKSCLLASRPPLIRQKYLATQLQGQMISIRRIPSRFVYAIANGGDISEVILNWLPVGQETNTDPGNALSVK